MSLIPHRLLPRSNLFDFDNWFRHSLDFFDPFDELDSMFSRHLHWLHRPFFGPSTGTPFLTHRVPEKYRITVDCAGYNPKSLSTQIRDGKLIVSGREESKVADDDYAVKEFKKTYKVPDNAQVDKFVSFHAGDQLVIEIPLRNEQLATTASNTNQFEDLFPQIIDGKQMKLSCLVPKDLDPKKLSVTCKDRDLIIKAEDKQESEDRMSSMYYYKQFRLPDNVDLNALKCELSNNRLTVQAPVLQLSSSSERSVPIQHVSSATHMIKN